ncbi:hypothetical protein HY485_01000, partial [Candidatus Woesearchaeota archaeon]|nr:hypothetical protein [Candidatus Woesearchaeota archaeon]
YKGISAKNGLKIIGTEVEQLGYKVKKLLNDGYLRLLTEEEKKENVFTNAFNLELEYGKQQKEQLTPLHQLTSNSAPSEQALTLLKDTNVFNKITETELDKRIVGEIENRKTIFLCACGSLVENNNIASYNLMVNSNSGAGKDYVVDNVLKIFPKANVEKRSRISPTAFTYWHNSKFEPDWSWDCKVCYLTDVSENVLNSDVFKVMCSEGSSATIVIDHKAVDIKINGKPVIIITQAKSTPNDEMLRRFPIITLTESEKQTRLIMQRKAEAAVNGYTINYDTSITEALSHLKKVKVKIPFAQKLTAVFPSDHIIMRTHYDRFLDYIKASTAFHQYQRTKDEEGCAIAEPQDYDVARVAILQTTSNKFMLPLTKKQQELLRVTKELNDWFSIADLEKLIPSINERTLYRMVDGIKEHFFDIRREEKVGTKKPITEYKFRQQSDLMIPTWKEIEECKNLSINDNVSNNAVMSNNVNSSNTVNSKGLIDTLHQLTSKITPQQLTITPAGTGFNFTIGDRHIGEVEGEVYTPNKPVLYRNEGRYCICSEAIIQAQRRGAKKVVVADEELGVVYTFLIDTFLSKGKVVMFGDEEQIGVKPEDSKTCELTDKGIKLLSDGRIMHVRQNVFLPVAEG